MSELARCVYSRRCWAPLAFTPGANQLLSEPASIPNGGRSTGVIVLAKTKLRSTARLLVAAAAIKWVRLDIHTKSHKNKQAKEKEGTNNQPLYLTLKNTAWNWPLEVL